MYVRVPEPGAGVSSSILIEKGPVVRTSFTSKATSLGLILLAGIGIFAQLQCSSGGGDDGGSTAPPPAGVTGDVKAIARENALPGTGAWQIGTPATSSQFAAYSHQESY